MTLHRILILWVAVIFTVGCGTKQSKPSLTGTGQDRHTVLLPADDFEKKLTEVADKQVVDVRTPEEYTGGHIKGALNINYQGEHFMDEIAKLDKNKPVFVYCEMGGRSAEASAYMEKQGFKQIYELKNGLKSWKHFGKPVE